MGREIKEAGEKHVRRMGIAFTATEYKHISDASAKQGITKADYIRRALGFRTEGRSGYNDPRTRR